MSGNEIDTGIRAGTPTRERARRRTLALLAGLIATAITWAAGEASVDRFAQKKVVNPLTDSPDLAGFNRILVKNAALSLGLQGAGLALTLAVVGARIGGTRRGPVAGLVGFGLGGLLGAAGSYGVFTASFATVDANTHDLLPVLLAQGTVAALIGVSAGLAYGIARGGTGVLLRAAIAGLAGAVVGACGSQILGAILFPGDLTGDPIPGSWLPRLLSHAMVDLATAFLVVEIVESARDDRRASSGQSAQV